MKFVLAVLLLAACVSMVAADIYMHYPPGSNNRLNARAAATQNQNRLYDSQNNANGGYNKGGQGNDENADRLFFYEGSQLTVEWTSQHACNNPKVHCNYIIQYMCDNTGDMGPLTPYLNGDGLRDGTNRNTINNEGQTDRGRHESEMWYRACEDRERNLGLFTADQDLDGDEAIYTRQNTNGNRRGFECPEERDYYPYWHPTPWKDVAYITDDHLLCDREVVPESQNTKDKGWCSDVRYNQRDTCNCPDCTWHEGGAWGLPAPLCRLARWNRQNHLGNGLDAQPNTFNWTIPSTELRDGADRVNCVLRMRYNISTGDTGEMGRFSLDASMNGDKSPVKDNPVINVGFNQGLRLAHNTDQTGRVFQSRSHVFQIAKRPEGVPADAKIYNLGARGKRGNIVQVYPAVEYDYVPARLVVEVNDYIHFQWLGTNTQPGGRAGQGTDGTDRHNLVQMPSSNENFPYTPEQVTLFDDLEEVREFALAGSTQENGGGLLNDAPPHWQKLKQMRRGGIYHTMCTRNNHFTNRTQKGIIIVDDGSLPVPEDEK